MSLEGKLCTASFSLVKACLSQSKIALSIASIWIKDKCSMGFCIVSVVLSHDYQVYSQWLKVYNLIIAEEKPLNLPRKFTHSIVYLKLVEKAFHCSSLAIVSV